MTRTRTALVVLSLVALAALIGCAKPGIDPGSNPGITGVRISTAPNLRTPIATFPWCSDPQGHSPTYPCMWDKRKRPAPDWDVLANPIAIWVGPGLPCFTNNAIDTDEAGGAVGWSCYLAPSK